MKNPTRTTATRTTTKMIPDKNTFRWNSEYLKEYRSMSDGIKQIMNVSRSRLYKSHKKLSLESTFKDGTEVGTGLYAEQK